MNEETLNYEEWVEEALRVVIRRALEQTVLNGLPDNHHFFITFLTSHADVEIPDHLQSEHPADGPCPHPTTPEPFYASCPAKRAACSAWTKP